MHQEALLMIEMARKASTRLFRTLTSTLRSRDPCENQEHLELDIIIPYFKEFSVIENILLLKIGLSPVHESLYRSLYDIVRDKLDLMGLKRDIRSTGSTEVNFRCPKGDQILACSRFVSQKTGTKSDCRS